MSTNNNEELNITRVLNLSTAHITKNTAETLCRCALNNDYIPLCTVLEKGEYGWYVYINDSEEPDQIPDELSDIRDCVIFALKHDITCICFDRDADTVVGLPVYNWEDLEQKQDTIFYIAVEEIRSTVVEVEAENQHAAIKKVEKAYSEDIICLNNADYINDGTSFYDETEKLKESVDLGYSTNFQKIL